MWNKKKSLKAHRPRKRKHLDPRPPTSVTEVVIKGQKYTVRVFDEELYRENMARYYGEPACILQRERKEAS